jgi:hypothetical protein
VPPIAPVPGPKTRPELEQLTDTTPRATNNQHARPLFIIEPASES